MIDSVIEPHSRAPCGLQNTILKACGRVQIPALTRTVKAVLIALISNHLMISVFGRAGIAGQRNPMISYIGSGPHQADITVLKCCV